jgi:hypothetical protein
MSAERHRRIRAALAAAALQPCLLCGDPPAAVAMFTPSAAPDRLAAYSLCATCLERPDKAQVAEDLLLGRAG